MDGAPYAPYVLPLEPHWTAVTGPDITPYWAGIWPLIELAVRRTRGRHDEQSVYASICARDFQVWLAGNNAVPVQLALVTEIVYYPKATWCRIIFCGGSDVAQYTPFLEQLEDWAKRSGCVGVEVVGRLGWARRLPAAYRSISQVYQKEFA